MQRSTADKLTFLDAGNPPTVCQAAAAEDHGSQHATPEGVYTVDGQSTGTELILANSIPILSLSLSFSVFWPSQAPAASIMGQEIQYSAPVSFPLCACAMSFIFFLSE